MGVRVPNGGKACSACSSCMRLLHASTAALSGTVQCGYGKFPAKKQLLCLCRWMVMLGSRPVLLLAHAFCCGMLLCCCVCAVPPASVRPCAWVLRCTTTSRTSSRRSTVSQDEQQHKQECRSSDSSLDSSTVASVATANTAVGLPAVQPAVQATDTSLAATACTGQ